MTVSPTSALDELLQPLPDSVRATLLQEIRKLSVHRDDDELFKLLRILGLYAAYYESIPQAIHEAHEQAIARIEALLPEEHRKVARADQAEILRLQEQLEAALNTLRSSVPPPFEEFRGTVESLQANAATINRHSRELIVELQKGAALSRHGWTKGPATLIFTAVVSAVAGAAGCYGIIRLLHLWFGFSIA